MTPITLNSQYLVPIFFMSLSFLYVFKVFVALRTSNKDVKMPASWALGFFLFALNWLLPISGVITLTIKIILTLVIACSLIYGGFHFKPRGKS